MQLKMNGEIIYNGRLLSDLEISNYKNSYDNVFEVYSNEECLIKRQAAYKAESDPLYMEWQFDQTTESEQAWRDKVTEIKASYPLTVES